MPCEKCDICTVLSLSGCQVPTKDSLSLPSANKQETENVMEGSRVEIRMRRQIIHRLPYWAEHI